MGISDFSKATLLAVSESWTSLHCSTLHGSQCCWWPEVPMRCDPCFLLQPYLPYPTWPQWSVSFWSSLSPLAVGPLPVPFLEGSSHLCLVSLLLQMSAQLLLPWRSLCLLRARPSCCTFSGLRVLHSILWQLGMNRPLPLQTGVSLLLGCQLHEGRLLSRFVHCSIPGTQKRAA